jgi:hypothetical protein
MGRGAYAARPEIWFSLKGLLALACFKARLCFVNYIYTAFAAHDATIAVAALKGAKRVLDFHSHSPIHGRRSRRLKFAFGGAEIWWA